MSFAVLRAHVSHLDVLVPLFDAYRQFYRQASDVGAARMFLRERLEREESVIFLAREREGAEVRGLGFVQLYPLFSSVRMKPLWLLNDLFVIPEARRMGVAHWLMDRARVFAQETGAAQVILATEKTNMTAKRLYHTLGYRRDNAFDHYELDV